MAELVRAGIEVAPIRTHTDGGMHPVFVAKLRPQRQIGAVENADETTTQGISQNAISRDPDR
jgi:hypothetical protein